MRFMVIFFGTIMILVVVAIILLMNRPVGGYHFF